MDKKLGFFDYYLLPFKKYAQFSGRATRSEFWYFHLCNFLIAIFFNILFTIAVAIDNKPPTEGTLLEAFIIFLFLAYSVALIIPSLALVWRRLHDTNRSGAWYFLSFTGIGFIPLIIFFCQKSDPAPNRFDEDSQSVPSDRHYVSPSAGSGNLEQIEKLAALRDRGVLTEEEFQKKKSELL